MRTEDAVCALRRYLPQLDKRPELLVPMQNLLDMIAQDIEELRQQAGLDMPRDILADQVVLRRAGHLALLPGGAG